MLRFIPPSNDDAGVVSDAAAIGVVVVVVGALSCTEDEDVEPSTGVGAGELEAADIHEHNCCQ